MPDDRIAFGWPGIAPTWTSSTKDLVTTALGSSRIWATVGYGILNEVYWPATGQPQIRDLGFILARGDKWIELKRAQSYTVTRPQPYIPLPQIVHVGPDYRFSVDVVADPYRDVLLLSYALEGDYQVYVMLAPHLSGSGLHNSAWVDTDLFAQSGASALALVPSDPYARASVGYVGQSDGWQDFAKHGRMTYEFTRADDGNVALFGELASPVGVLALGFSDTPSGARTLAASSLAEGFSSARTQFETGWKNWSERLHLPAATAVLADEAFLSATMIKVHEDRTYPGAVVASLSIPWGNTSDSRGGYHLVWTRDAVEAALALLVVGQRDDAACILAYLVSTQLPDGHWHQNFNPDGQPFWTGIQLDEAAFPVLLAAKLLESGASLGPPAIQAVRRALEFIVRVGPTSPQDRWEENSGANPFTLAVEIAALVAAAGLLSPGDRDYALSLADCWNERIEEWCYVRGTDLANRLGVPGYYVRLGMSRHAGPQDRVALSNRAGETMTAADLVGLEFMHLVRLGLRRADDSRILASLKVVDAVLRVETPSGLLYHRYNGDGYGEHEDGRAYDGSGIGRAWPMLTGERAHLALAAGEDVLPYLETMRRTAGPCGLLPEQAWDAAAIPEHGLFPGKPTGSAMPLVWAHAEFLKLLIARDVGRPCERVRAVDERYAVPRPATAWHWRTDTPIDVLPVGRDLIVEASQPFSIRWGTDQWQNASERTAEAIGLGMYGVRFAADAFGAAREVNFTRRFVDDWEGIDYVVTIGR